MRRSRALALGALSAAAVWMLVIPTGRGAGCALPIPKGTEPSGRLLITRTRGTHATVQAKDADGDGVDLVSPWYSLGRMRPESPRWSPDGSRVAWVTRGFFRDALHVADADGRHVRRLTFNRQRVRLVGWAPDGEGVVVARDRQPRPGLFLVEVDGSGDRPILPPGLHGLPGAELSAEGHILLVEADDAPGAPVQILEPPWLDARAVTTLRSGLQTLSAALSPDGRWFATATEVVDTATGARRPISAPIPEGLDVVDRSPAGSPRGDLVAFVRSLEVGTGSPFGYRWSVVVSAAPRGDCSHTFALPAEPTDPVWAPDGRHLAFSLAAGDGWFRDVYVLDIRTGAVTTATRTRGSDEVVGDWR